MKRALQPAQNIESTVVTIPFIVVNGPIFNAVEIDYRPVLLSRYYAIEALSMVGKLVNPPPATARWSGRWKTVRRSPSAIGE
jgi:hypothetical protein